MSPFMALFGHGAISELSLLSGVKRKLDFRARQGQLLARSGRSCARLQTTKLAVDSQFEHGYVASATFDLELRSARPNVLGS
jgi:hypothetical protein